MQAVATLIECQDRPKCRPGKVCRSPRCRNRHERRSPYCSERCKRWHARHPGGEVEPAVRPEAPLDPEYLSLSVAELLDLVGARHAGIRRGWTEAAPRPSGSPVHATGDPTGASADLLEIWRVIRHKRAGQDLADFELDDPLLAAA